MTHPAQVVYDLQVERGRPVLRLVSIETRKFLDHDAGIAVPGLPEIFVLHSAPGMSQAVWKASCTPMKALGALTDAGIPALEDIDRLAVFAEEKRKAEAAEEFGKKLAAFAAATVAKIEATGGLKLPWPYPVAHAIADHNEKERRTNLAAERLKRESEGA